MTTSDTRRDIRTRAEGRLRARLWIGQNPVVFVALCAVLGYWLGRGTVRGDGR